MQFFIKDLTQGANRNSAVVWTHVLITEALTSKHKHALKQTKYNKQAYILSSTQYKLQWLTEQYY